MIRNIWYKQCLKVFWLVVLLALSKSVFPQTGIGTNNPHPTAQLEVFSEDKGFLIPRMTQTERGMISSPAIGLLVFQTDGDHPGFYYYSSTGWRLLGVVQSLPGTIIPFSSGTSVTLATGMPAPGAVLGFGAWFPLSITPGESILATDVTFPNALFVVPQPGTIQSIFLYFSSIEPDTQLDGEVNLIAQVYRSGLGNNDLMPIPESRISIELPSPFQLGDVFVGAGTDLNISININDRLLLVCYLEGDSETTNQIIGYISAGIELK